MRYSSEFKENVLKKVFAPHAPGIPTLAKEVGVPSMTLYNWVRLKKANTMSPSQNLSVAWSPEQKLSAVVQSLTLSEPDFGQFLREKGLYVHQIEEWRQEMLASLHPLKPSSLQKEYQQAKAQIKSLEHELRQKEKALAEASVLLVLKKKASLIWGVADEEKPY